MTSWIFYDITTQYYAPIYSTTFGNIIMFLILSLFIAYLTHITLRNFMIGFSFGMLLSALINLIPFYFVFLSFLLMAYSVVSKK